MSVEETIADLQTRKAQLEAAADLLGRNTCIGDAIAMMAGAFDRTALLVPVFPAHLLAAACVEVSADLSSDAPGLIAATELSQLLRGIHNVDELRVVKAAREAAAAGVDHVDGH